MGRSVWVCNFSGRPLIHPVADPDETDYLQYLEYRFHVVTKSLLAIMVAIFGGFEAGFSLGGNPNDQGRRRDHSDQTRG